LRRSLTQTDLAKMPNSRLESQLSTKRELYATLTLLPIFQVRRHTTHSSGSARVVEGWIGDNESVWGRGKFDPPPAAYTFSMVSNGRRYN